MVALIAPVALTAESRHDRRRRYEAAWPSVRMDLQAIDASTPLPERLNSADDIATLSAAFGELFARTDEPTIPDCMLDPGLEHAGDDDRVRGLFHLITELLQRTGRRVVLVSRNAAMRDRMQWLVERYDATGVCTTCYDLDIPGAEAFDAARWADGVRTIRDAGEDADVLACCTGVAFAPEVAAELRILTPYDVIAELEPDVKDWSEQHG